MSEKTITRLTPIVRELPADLETPVSVYLKLAGQGPSFLLESVTGGEQVARYSFIGVNPSQAFVLRGQSVEVHRLKPGNGSGQDLAAASAGLTFPEQELTSGERVVSGQEPSPARRTVSNQVLPTGQNPLNFLRDILARFEYQPVPGLPRFAGGLVGFAGYEMMRFFEPSLALAPHLQLPDAIFLLADTIIAFDHAFGRLLLIGNAEVSGVNGRSEASINAHLDAIEARLAAPLSNTISPLPGSQPPATTRPLSDTFAPASGLQIAAGGGSNETPMASTSLRPTAAGLITANMTYEQYTTAVEAAKEHIAAGDIFQVVLSQRMERQTSAAPFDIYRALRRLNPSPYMFYLDFGHLAGLEPLRLIGASPEIHARLEGQAASVRPIAGTRPRGKNNEEDLRLEQDLLADPKELAEHVMLVDLGRNDLGRVCRFGTVATPEKMIIERYSHVMHIVSHVTGELQPGYDAFDLLQATFPAGTVSGAPKIRAMQIISELEVGPRGPYAGIVGYFSFDRSMDTCIAIRTMVMRGQTVSLQAGAGIVADSTPEREYQETLNKLRGQMAAIDLAEKV